MLLKLINGLLRHLYFNHPDSKVIVDNIESLTDKELGKNITSGDKHPDVILGGPPCQGFSICRKGSGDPKDPRNSLFNEFLRLGRTILTVIYGLWRMFLI